MKKLSTYTPTNFRKHSYDLFNQVKDDKRDVRVTLHPKHGGKNTNLLVVKETTIKKLLEENRQLREQDIARKIDFYTSQLSNNQVFKDPVKFEKWCEKSDE